MVTQDGATLTACRLSSFGESGMFGAPSPNVNFPPRNTSVWRVMLSS
jgi:hypothetical protein